MARADRLACAHLGGAFGGAGRTQIHKIDAGDEQGEKCNGAEDKKILLFADCAFGVQIEKVYIGHRHGKDFAGFAPRLQIGGHVFFHKSGDFCLQIAGFRAGAQAQMRDEHVVSDHVGLPIQKFREVAAVHGHKKMAFDLALLLRFFEHAADAEIHFAALEPGGTDAQHLAFGGLVAKKFMC